MSNTSTGDGSLGGYSKPFYLNLAILAYCSSLEITLYSGETIVKELGVLLSIPVILGVLIMIRIPCVFMEISLGQYANKGAIKIWDMCPIFRGAGFCGFIVFILRQATYTVNSTYLLFMAFSSITPEIEWTSCNKSWATIFCYTYDSNLTSMYLCKQALNESACENGRWETSLQQYYYYRILNLDRSGRLGLPQYELTGYCLLTICLVIWCTYNTPKSTEHALLVITVVAVLEFTAVLYLTLIDPGGITTFQTVPSRHKVIQLDSWNELIQQMVNSPGLGLGAYVTFGMQTSFRSPILLKVVVVNIMDAIVICLYSTLLQNMMAVLNFYVEVPPLQAVNTRSPLAITMVPMAISYMKGVNTNLWCFIWFSHTYLIALRSLVVMMSINVFVTEEHFPKLKKYRMLTVMGFCLFIFGMNIICYTRGGLYIQKSIHLSMRSHVQTLINGIQLCSVFYIYGLSSFIDDLQFMLGIRTPVFWNFFYAISPILVAACYISGIIWHYIRGGDETPAREKPIYKFTQTMALWFTPVVVLIYAVVYVYRNRRVKNFKWFGLSKEWGPRDKRLMRSREMFSAHTMTKEYIYRQERLKMRNDPAAATTLSHESQT